MDARKTRWAIAAVMIATWTVPMVQGATYRTPNFVVTAPTKDFAAQVGKAAEYYRKELAVAWLGKELRGTGIAPVRLLFGWDRSERVGRPHFSLTAEKWLGGR